MNWGSKRIRDLKVERNAGLLVFVYFLGISILGVGNLFIENYLSKKLFFFVNL